MLSIKKRLLNMKYKIWTFELLQAEAAEYSSRNAFNKGSRQAYKAAWRRGILDEEVLSQRSEQNRNVKAMKTRQTLKKMSVREFLVKLMRKNKTQGFRLLEKENREDAAYENVIIKFKELFVETPDVIDIAHERLNLKT